MLGEEKVLARDWLLDAGRTRLNTGGESLAQSSRMSATSKKISYLLAAMAIAIVAIPRFLQGVPWLIQFPNSGQMVLYNDNEVSYHSSTQTLGFFLPSTIHSFFPLSFVFSRVFYVLIPSPVLVEFVMPEVVTFLLLFAFGRSWLRRAPGNGKYLVLLAFGAFSLFYVTALSPWFWFRSIGSWGLITFLVLLASKQARARSIFLFLVFFSMVLGDDGLMAVSALFFLLVQSFYSSQSRRFYLRMASILGLLILAYEAAIGISGFLYFGSYSASFEAQILGILNFNLQTHLSAVSLPQIQSVGLIAASFVLFVLFPIVLATIYIRSHLPLRNLILAALILLVGDGVRIAYTISAQPQYNNLPFEIILYLAFPLSILGLAGVKRTAVSRVGIHESPTPRHLVLSICIVFACVLILSTFWLNPLLIGGPVQRVTDPRVLFISLQDAGIVIHNYSPSLIAVERFSDASILFVGPPQQHAAFALVSSLPSPFPGGQPDFSNKDVLFSNGVLQIIADNAT